MEFQLAGSCVVCFSGACCVFPFVFGSEAKKSERLIVPIIQGVCFPPPRIFPLTCIRQDVPASTFLGLQWACSNYVVFSLLFFPICACRDNLASVWTFFILSLKACFFWPLVTMLPQSVTQCLLILKNMLTKSLSMPFHF
jgi:hypothetical protein